MKTTTEMPSLTDFMKSVGYTCTHQLFPEIGWSVKDPSGAVTFMKLEELENIALGMGWEEPKDENGYAFTRSKEPCCGCGYAPGFMAMYTNGERTVCARCRPINNLDRANARAFAACEAAYLDPGY